MDEWAVIFGLHVSIYWLSVALFKDAATPAKDFKTACAASLKNQIFHALPVTYVFFQGVKNWYPGYHGERLSFYDSLPYLPLQALTTDCYFHIMHRIMHTKLFWGFHRKHHDAKTHVAKALDGDMLEHIFVNLFSVFFGVWVLQYFFGILLDSSILYIWCAISNIAVMQSHRSKEGGKNLGRHERHHIFVKCNYGVGLYALDRLTGTFR